MSETKELATTKGRVHALEQLKHRRENKPEQTDNGKLPAGFPMYFYCISCGHESDRLPESYVGRPKKLCPECQALKDLDWLE